MAIAAAGGHGDQAGSVKRGGEQAEGVRQGIDIDALVAGGADAGGVMAEELAEGLFQFEDKIARLQQVFVS